MLCSARELALDLGPEDGILILDQGSPIGSPVEKILGLDEKILSLDLTPNRSDCLGMINFSYEVAALTGGKVKLPPINPQENAKAVESKAGVKVIDKDLCPRYTARVIEKVKVGSSPLWLQLKLLKAGIRPISNIVDVTNYVMLEFGQPLHAFDLKQVGGQEIIVRRAIKDEELVTLDGTKRILNPEVLVIADNSKAIGLAGVMGGENTEIGSETTEVLIEAAVFNPASIRKTVRQLSLPSEASQRFERGVDPLAVMSAQNRASLMISEISGGEVLKGVIDVNHSDAAPTKILVSTDRINKVLGMSIERQEISDILKRLGFSLAEIDQQLEVTVPLRRPDVKLEEDIIEEVARLNGYDKIPTTLPEGKLIENRESESERLKYTLRNLLISCGFYECTTYSFMNPLNLELLRLPSDDIRLQAIPVQNPLSEEQGIMRTTLLPGILKAVKHNFNHRELDQLLFEIGIVYKPQSLPLDKLPHEQVKICLAVTGEIPGANWTTLSRKADYYTVKGVLELIFSRLQIKNTEFRTESEPFTHPTRSASIYINQKFLGYIGQLHPEVQQAWGLNQEVTVCEIDFDLLFLESNLVPRVFSVPRYPAAIRDLALVAPGTLTALQLEDSIRKAAGESLKTIKLFDLYEGSQIPEGKRSLAYSLTFRDDHGTLTDNEVKETMKKIEDALIKLGVVLRG
jgi:phenylalanyl-tRNA synthetase beta chain